MPSSPNSPTPPIPPIGLDSYRLWHQWPQLRIGVRAYMRSTRDRSGANEAACSSHYLYQERPDFNVVTDIEGPGVLYFWRTNRWHGSPWHYETDGEDHIVAETATADPVTAHVNIYNDPPLHTFIPKELFDEPLCWTWTTTKGADLNWRPVPFEKSLRVAYGRTFYGTGYGILHRHMPGLPLSQELKTFDWESRVPDDVNALMAAAGTDIAPAEGVDGTVAQHSTVTLPQGTPVEIAALAEGPGMVRALRISAPRERAMDLGAARIRITWDDRPHASVNAPLALFFGVANFDNRDDREYLIKGLPLSVRFTEDRIECSCYFPMPYYRSARITLEGQAAAPLGDVTCEVRTQPYTGPLNHVGYFHATYADTPVPEKGRDVVLLDTRHVEGGGDWTGHVVGTSFIFTQQGHLNTLEGIPRFFFDDALSPQGYGTGTEEWGGGGDYWGGQNMTLPLAGHPCGNNKPDHIFHGEKEKHAVKMPIQLTHSAYRFLLADLMPFGRNAQVHLEHGGENDTAEHYESVAYWYGLPDASLVVTDTLDIGDTESEKSHGYNSPQASDPFEVTSRFEWGVDHLHGKEIFPAHTEVERHHTTESQFTLALNADNLGVMLRRTFDYLYPNQRAEVSVRGSSDDEWQPVGTWYTPGSNTCVFSYGDGSRTPESEAGGPANEERTVNRRFIQSEFMIGPSHTSGQESIQVRIVHAPKERELWPGNPFPSETAWSEIRYDVYCLRMPTLDI